jgi:hypothetical protein
MYEHSRVLASYPLSAWEEFLPRAQPPVFLPEPAHRAVVDALKERMQFLEAESP